MWNTLRYEELRSPTLGAVQRLRLWRDRYGSPLLGKWAWGILQTWNCNVYGNIKVRWSRCGLCFSQVYEYQTLKSLGNQSLWVGYKVEISSHMQNCKYIRILFHVCEIITETFFPIITVLIFNVIYVAIIWWLSPCFFQRLMIQFWHTFIEERTDTLPLTCCIHRARDVAVFFFGNTAEVLKFKGLLLILINYFLFMYS
jgi:hypothetical protein